MMMDGREAPTVNNLHSNWETLGMVGAHIDPYPKRLRMRLVMKRSAFLVAMDRPIVSWTVCCRCFSPIHAYLSDSHGALSPHPL